MGDKVRYREYRRGYRALLGRWFKTWAEQGDRVPFCEQHPAALNGITRDGQPRSMRVEPGCACC